MGRLLTLVPLLCVLLWLAHVSHRASLQSALLHAPVDEQHHEASVTSADLAKEFLGLPRPLCMPSSRRPFVFFHQRKSGGTSLRQELAGAVDRNQLNASIDCLTTDCLQYRMPIKQTSVVYAGHYTWDSLAKEPPDTPRRRRLSCVTVFRHPIDRITSCYYYAMKDVQIVGGTPLSAYTPDQLRRVFTDPERQNGEGCLNEPLRIFSTDYDQDMSVLLQLYRKKTLQTELDDISTNQTHRMLTYWFPWLSYATTHLNTNPQHTEQSPLTPAQEAVLRELASAEFEVWEWAKRRYEVQKAFLNSLTDTKPMCLRAAINKLRIRLWRAQRDARSTVER